MEKKFAFTKYSSIENSYRIKEIETIVEQGKAGGEWCVSEKCHGSNSSIWYDGESFKIAKRTAFLGEDSNFFNADYILETHKEKIKKIWEFLNEHTPKGEITDFEELVLFGEIFGGVYTHPDVNRDNRSTKVQKEVQYSPSNHFYCFDIKIDGSFIKQNFVEELCEDSNIFYARTLFKGTMQECIDYPNDYESTIPALLGLPAIENNVTEGNVIKPMIPDYHWNGSRIILKNKNDKFKEKHDKGGKNKKPKVKEEIVLSENAQKMLDEILLFITENRLRNVLSKVGTITNKQFGLLMGQYSQDIFEDFLKDNKEEFTLLEKHERKQIQKQVGNVASTLIRTNFLNIIDATY